MTAQRDLAAHHDGRRDLEDRRSRAADDAERSRLSAEIEALEKEIGVAKSRIDTARMELERRKDTVERTIDTINRCIDYRLAVMNYFAYATDKVRSESDPALRAYADKLRSMYAESIDGHEKQISDRKRGVETCKKELP